MGRLDREIALITGGASGLGNAIAIRLAGEGARVVITDIQQDLGREAAAAGGFDFLAHDVCDEVQWDHVVRRVEDRCGPLTVLVNCAGTAGTPDGANPESMQLDVWRKMFAVNVESVFLGCRSAIPAMRRGGHGSIINIASVAGLIATPGAIAYGASKAAVRQITKSVARYCAQERLNIRCNSVHPGPVQTPLLDKHLARLSALRGMPLEEVLEELRAQIPMGELARPEDVAAAVCFLASEDSRHITGDKLLVDGGAVNCGSFRPAATSGVQLRSK